MKNILKILIFITFAPSYLFANTNDNLYKKIDLFGEVLEKIKKRIC